MPMAAKLTISGPEVNVSAGDKRLAAVVTMTIISVQLSFRRKAGRRCHLDPNRTPRPVAVGIGGEVPECVLFAKIPRHSFHDHVGLFDVLREEGPAAARSGDLNK